MTDVVMERVIAAAYRAGAAQALEDVRRLLRGAMGGDYTCDAAYSALEWAVGRVQERMAELANMEGKEHE